MSLDVQEVKPLYLSKTLWVNALVAVAAFIPGVGQKIVENPEIAVNLLVLVNLVLRFVTKSKLELY